MSQIGHLSEVIEAWAVDHGAMARWTDQIIDAAREQGPGAVTHDFNWSYDFSSVQYSHGNSTVKGHFNGRALLDGRYMQLQGQTDYVFSDDSTDPASIRQYLQKLFNISVTIKE